MVTCILILHFVLHLTEKKKTQNAIWYILGFHHIPFTAWDAAYHLLNMPKFSNKTSPWNHLYPGLNKSYSTCFCHVLFSDGDGSRQPIHWHLNYCQI
jgi:hypothetical protein